MSKLACFFGLIMKKLCASIKVLLSSAELIFAMEDGMTTNTGLYTLLMFRCSLSLNLMGFCEHFKQLE